MQTDNQVKPDARTECDSTGSSPARCSVTVWTSQKFGPEKETWTQQEVAEWERHCQPLDHCECGARMTERASTEWLNGKCGDCFDWNAYWNGDDDEVESPNGEVRQAEPDVKNETAERIGFACTDVLGIKNENKK